MLDLHFILKICNSKRFKEKMNLKEKISFIFSVSLSSNMSYVVVWAPLAQWFLCCSVSKWLLYRQRTLCSKMLLRHYWVRLGHWMTAVNAEHTSQCV